MGIYMVDRKNKSITFYCKQKNNLEKLFDRKTKNIKPSTANKPTHVLIIVEYSNHLQLMNRSAHSTRPQRHNFRFFIIDQGVDCWSLRSVLLGDIPRNEMSIFGHIRFLLGYCEYFWRQSRIGNNSLLCVFQPLGHHTVT